MTSTGWPFSALTAAPRKSSPLRPSSQSRRCGTPSHSGCRCASAHRYRCRCRPRRSSRRRCHWRQWSPRRCRPCRPCRNVLILLDEQARTLTNTTRIGDRNFIIEPWSKFSARSPTCTTTSTNRRPDAHSCRRTRWSSRRRNNRATRSWRRRPFRPMRIASRKRGPAAPARRHCSITRRLARSLSAGGPTKS